MTFTDLYTNLKSLAKKKNIEAYKDQKVAIDGYGWLHKGA